MRNQSRSQSHEVISYDYPAQLLGAAAVSAFRVEALSLADDQVDGLSVDPAIMMTNIRIGVASVQPRFAEVVAARPRTNTAWILSLPNLGRAVEHLAANTVVTPTFTREQLDATYAELQRHRMPALLIAQALSSDLFKKLPADVVANIVAGQGIYDHGQDGISLASLFREHARAIAGMHPFTPEHLATMERLGATLCESVTPSGARAKKPATANTNADLRDRFWTLVRIRHVELRRAGIELFGEDGVDERVPRLGVRARVPAGKAANDVAPVTPVTPAAPSVPPPDL